MSYGFEKLEKKNFEIGRGESFTLATGKLYKADGDEVSAGAPGLAGRFYLNGTDIETELDLSGYVVGTGVLIDCMTGEECAGLSPGDYGYVVRIFEDGAGGESTTVAKGTLRIVDEGSPDYE